MISLLVLLKFHSLPFNPLGKPVAVQISQYYRKFRAKNILLNNFQKSYCPQLYVRFLLNQHYVQFHPRQLLITTDYIRKNFKKKRR